MSYAICFFPAVGVLCGGLTLGWYALSSLLDLSSVLFAAVAACLPLLVTGGIHMDGYMDTVVVTHGGVIAAIMEHLFPAAGKSGSPGPDRAVR